jgi:hypothetical protein
MASYSGYQGDAEIAMHFKSDAPGKRLVKTFDGLRTYLPILVCLWFVFDWSEVFAQIAIGPIGADATYLEVNKPRQVKITAVINYSDADVPKVILQRVNLDGSLRTLGVLQDDGRNGDAVAKDKIFTFVVQFYEKEAGRIHLRVSADFSVAPPQTVFEELFIPVGVVVAPRAGATVKGPHGTSITIAPNSIQYEAVIGIAPVPSSAIIAPLGKLGLVSAIDIIFLPTFFKAEIGPPESPLQISLPIPPKTRSSRFIIAQEVRSDSISEPRLGLRQQLVPVSTAVLIKRNIVSQKSVFTGILGGGLFAILEATGSGYVTGIVSEQNVPRAGVVVSSTTNTLVSITDATGHYSLFISGGPFTVTAFHPFRGSSGSASGNIAVNQSTITADIVLTPLVAPPVTRDGVRNGGFERCDLTSWTKTGTVNVIQSLGPTSTGVTVSPTEGRCMVDLVTGGASIGSVGSGLKQNFIVPAGVSHLRFDVNFVSEEFPEFVGSQYDDAFRALITTPNGQTTAHQITVNQSGGFTLMGDCFFPGGDATCGQTGWRESSIDLSNFAQLNTPVSVELLFTVTDAGDNIYDTHVLIDNIRFRTLWLDAKIISGAGADVVRIQREVLAATEILSQAGLNVRLRPNPQTLNQAKLVDVDLSWSTAGSACLPRQNGRLTADATQLMAQARSATNTDINVYYVKSISGQFVFGKGWSINPDEYCNEVNILTNSGTIQTDSGDDRFLAHELGHLLISPDSSGSSLEHGSGSGNFMLPNPPTALLGILTRQQSQKINPSSVLGP